MKALTNSLRYLNLFFAGTGGAIALGQVPKFFPELQIYGVLFWAIGLVISVVLWFLAAVRQQISDGWIPFIITISLLLLLVDEVRMLWF